MNSFYEDGKVKLYQKDNRGYQIIERENDFMHISKLREMEDYRNLENYCTEINGGYLPVNVLAHVVKHFPGESNPQKLSLLEDLLDFENKGYSYVVYTTVDERFQMHKSKVKLYIKFIEVLRNNELYEICVTEAIKIGRKDPVILNQINSYYKVNSFLEERLEKLQYSEIAESYFVSNSEQYLIFQLTQDSRIGIEKPREVFEKENNHFAAKLLKATGNESIDLGKAFFNEEKIENPIDFPELFHQEEIIQEAERVSHKSNKLSTEDIMEFFKSKDGKITLKELVTLYETDTLPLTSNRDYTVNKIMKSQTVKKFSSLYFILNFLFNSKGKTFDCKNIVSDEKDLEFLKEEIGSQVGSLNKELRQEAFSFKGTVLKLEIKFA